MAKKLPSFMKVPSARASEQPATRKMLWLVRDELRSEIRASVRNLESKMESRFQRIDSRFEKMDSRFETMEAKLEKMHSSIISTNLLVEEQNANNRIVLEGLQVLWQRQDRLEQRLPER